MKFRRRVGMSLGEFASRSLRLLVIPALLVLTLANCQSIDDGTQTASAGEGGLVWKGPRSGLIPPFLEKAFRYRKPLEYSDGGRFMIAPYDELIDINERDAQPVRQVKSWWVRKLPKGAEVELEYTSGSKTLKYWAVGQLSGGSKMTIIYLHGRGGNREWGFYDDRFGGNFNRLKNLMRNAGGAFLSPDFTDFEKQGVADIKALLAKYRPLTSGKLVVACGSLGNAICWELLQDSAASRMVDGVVVLAGFPDERFLSSATVRSPSNNIPLVISHGTLDPDYDYRPMEAYYRKLRKTAPSYPVRIILFNTAKHGGPLRMIDWRDTLNWIDAQ